MGAKNKYDAIFKNKLKDIFLSLLLNFSKEKINKSAEITSQPIEFSLTVERDADFLFVATEKDKETLYHLEVQTENADLMLNRMLMYLALINERHNTKNREKPLFIKQILLFLGNEKTGSVGKCTMPYKKDFGSFVYEYQLIDITQISYKEFLKHPETYAFAILGKFDSKNEDKVIAEIKEKAVRHYKHKDNIREFLADLIMLSGLRNLKTEITKNTTIMALELHIEDHEFYKAGELKGKLEGELKGKLAGELKKALAIAEALILDKLPLKQVMKVTGLTLLQITELQLKITKENK